MSSLNCTTSDQLACARAAPATTIKSIIEHQDLLFGPVPDDITDSKNVTLALTNGTAANVSILIGTNYNDGSLFALQYPSSVFSSYLPYYPSPEYPTDLAKVGAIITDLSFQCPAAAIANLTAARGQPTWRYVYNASFANTQPLGGNYGAFHSSEIPEVFGTYNRNGASNTQGYLSFTMNTAWANFAKSPTRRPLNGWPGVSTTGGNDIQTFISTGKGVGPVVSSADIDSRCGLYVASTRSEV